MDGKRKRNRLLLRRLGCALLVAAVAFSCFGMVCGIGAAPAADEEDVTRLVPAAMVRQNYTAPSEKIHLDANGSDQDLVIYVLDEAGETVSAPSSSASAAFTSEAGFT